MKKTVLRIVILFLIYIGGIFFFGMFMNQERAENTKEMENPTMPVLCIDYNGEKINRMFGYTQEMNQETLRDGLIPLTTSRDISVSINDYGNKVDSVTYEVTNLMNGTVEENAKVSNFKADGDYETATFTLQEAILMNQEYGLRFTLHMGEEDIYYYTRVVQRASLNTDEYIEFAYNFYEKCLDKESASSLNANLETPEVVTNNSYTNIDITSSLNQVTWGNLDPQIYRRAIATVKEINENTGSIVLEYMISAEDEEGRTEYYYVTDFFRMRYYQSKIMLLNFYRNTQQVFDSELPVISTSGVELGIADKSVQYVTNESSNIAGFVQNGELWSYNSGADKLAKVYSLRSAQGGDERDDYSGNSIKIVRIGESGDIEFIVHGYQNRDVHEGKVGISVCHYSSERNSVEEKVFIPCADSSEFLAQDLQKLSYINNSDQFYFYMDNTVFCVDLNEKSYETVLTQINPDCFVASKDNGEIAWMNEMDTSSSANVTVMDLDTGEKKDIPAGDGNKIRALGFINDDFIYGIASDADIVTDVSGKTVFAMNDIRIEAFDGTVVKEYKIDGVWVTDVNIQEGLIELIRVVRNESGFVETTTDNIMNNQQDQQFSVTVKTSNTTRKGTVTTLAFPNTITNRNPLVSIGKQKLSEEDKTVEVVVEDKYTKPVYYVHARGKLQETYTSPADAIIEADAQLGTVLNVSQQYVWERGNSQSENEMNNEDIPQAVFSGNLDDKVLQEELGDSAEVMNLSGCTLEEILYQLSSDRAVIARRPDGTSSVMVGYDRYNTLLYDAATGEHTYYGMNDSTELFTQGGNVFISYVEKINGGN